MNQLATDWGVLKSNGTTFPVLLRVDGSTTGDLDRLDTLTDARVRLSGGTELTLDEQARTRLAGGRTAVVFAVAREG